MAKTETLQLRLSPAELARLRAYAQWRDIPMAQVLRFLIRQLPDPPEAD
jgi:hypothetical protein